MSHSDPLGNEHEGWLWNGDNREAMDRHLKRYTFGDPPPEPTEFSRAVEKEIRQAQADLKAQGWDYEGEPTVNPDTGAMKGRKDIELFTAPPLALREYGKVCSYGSNGKYAPNNWRLGFQWSLSANALLRHYLAWVGGEDLDPESGLHHMAHAMWHCAVLVQYATDHPELDDRFGGPACPATGGK